MDTNNNWQQSAHNEILQSSSSYFYMFWYKNFYHLCDIHKFQNEFELESESLDFEWIKFWFVRECEKLSSQYKLKLNIMTKRTMKILEFVRTITINKMKFRFQLFITISSKGIFLNIDSVAGVNALFEFYKYRSAFNIVKDICLLDISELRKNIGNVISRLYINEKSSQIAFASIENLCKTFLLPQEIKYNLTPSALSTWLYYYLPNSDQCISKKIVFKEFNENPRNFLKEIQNII